MVAVDPWGLLQATRGGGVKPRFVLDLLCFFNFPEIHENHRKSVKAATSHRTRPSVRAPLGGLRNAAEKELRALPPRTLWTWRSSTTVPSPFRRPEAALPYQPLSRVTCPPRRRLRPVASPPTGARRRASPRSPRQPAAPPPRGRPVHLINERVTVAPPYQ